MPRTQRNDLLRAALARHRERLTGRAARQVASLLDPSAAGTFASDACEQPILGARHIHIDPYGNVFPGTCAGVILGDAKTRSLRDIWADVAERYYTNPVLTALIDGGPHVLLQYAKMLGFEPRPTGYAGKCHLCTHVRDFLFESKVFEKRLGPLECYAAWSGGGEGEREGIDV
jgi:hypothetical protein